MNDLNNFRTLATGSLGTRNEVERKYNKKNNKAKNLT